MATDSVRDSIIFSFHTSHDRVRTLSLPDPAPGLAHSVVVAAADGIIGADVFDDSPGTPGRLQRLKRADLQKVTTRVLL